MVLILGPKDIKGLITIKDAVDAMEQGFGIGLIMLGWPNFDSVFAPLTGCG